MSGSREDTMTEVSTTGLVADTHIKKYYQALQSSRNTISSFFSPHDTMPDGKILPAILYNGNIIPDAQSYQQVFENQMPPTHYDVQSFDCQVINPNYIANESQVPRAPKGQNMTILIIVSGLVKFGTTRETETKGFSETFVLVPNLDNSNSNKRGRPGKDWLIQSLNFRFVA